MELRQEEPVRWEVRGRCSRCPRVSWEKDFSYSFSLCSVCCLKEAMTPILLVVEGLGVLLNRYSREGARTWQRACLPV